MNKLLNEKFEKTHITISELSRRTGIARETLSRYLSGKKRINKLEHICYIGLVLNFSYYDYLEVIIDNAPERRY